MNHRDGNFDGGDQASYYFQCWEPETPPRAVIVIAHGLAEHSGRYARLASSFVERGYAVAALDHFGHGQSDGEKGTVQDFDVFTDTLERFREMIARDYPDVPSILLGHSMGGLISTSHLIKLPGRFKGCVLSGPAIMSDAKPGQFQMAIVRFLSRFFPGLGIMQLDANGVSRDPEEVTRYVNDPLVYTGKVSARMAAELFRAMNDVQRDAGKIDLPILILHGGEDSMASPLGSRFLEANVGSAEKQLKIYPGLFHEIFNEPERDEVFKDVVEWCDGLIGRANRMSAL